MQWFGFLTSGFVSVRISLESGENGELGWLNRRVYFYETKLMKVNNEWIFVSFVFFSGTWFAKLKRERDLLALGVLSDS